MAPSEVPIFDLKWKNKSVGSLRKMKTLIWTHVPVIMGVLKVAKVPYVLIIQTEL